MLSSIRNSDEKQRWLLASTLLNALLAAAKLLWGWFMGSTLVMADGIHSISDVFGALLILLALHFALHKSERFPYGLHKLEDLAALVGGIGILFAGYEIVHSVFFEGDITTPDDIWMTVGFIAVIVGVQYLFYYFELKAAKRLNSPGVKADAVNWLGDIGAGAIVIVGLVSHYFAIPYSQEVAVVIIVLMIFKGAYDVIKEGLMSLLDAADIDLSKKIEQLVLSNSDVSAINRIMVRKSGSVYFADLELSIVDTGVAKAHASIDDIVKLLHEEISELEAVIIHYEPEHSEYEISVRLLDTDRTSVVDNMKNVAYLHLVKRSREDNSVISDNILENPVSTRDKGKAFKLVAWMISQHVNTIIMGHKEIDEDILALFDTLGITIKEGDA